MRLGYCFVLAVIVSVASPARATYLRLAADVTGTSCEIADPGDGGVVHVYVLLREAADVTGVMFSAPVPEAAGLVHAADNSTFLINGSSQAGAAVGFGACIYGSVTVMEMVFVRVGTGASCVEYYLGPYQPYGAEYTTCSFGPNMPLLLADGVVLNATASCGSLVPISNPDPPDGQPGVELSTQLSWRNAYYVCNAPLLTVTEGDLYFGTTPDPPHVGWVSSPYAVGPLLPDTQYFWKIRNEYPYVFSPVWSFTTTNSVATKQTTWGAIKALYR
jgi:hypothetical protein